MRVIRSPSPATDAPARARLSVEGTKSCVRERKLADQTLRLPPTALRERIGKDARERARSHSLPEIVAAYAEILAECARPRARAADGGC